MNFLKKLRNNKGSAESGMFVMGVCIFATIVVFSLNVFNLTWQRYLSTREVNNLARLYAIRSYDLYWDGTTQTQPTNSKLGKDMMNILDKVAKHTKITTAEFVITTEAGVQLFKLTASKSGGPSLSAVQFDVFKEVDYADTLMAKMTIKYDSQIIRAIAAETKRQEQYVITNKFAFEQKASNNTTIG